MTTPQSVLRSSIPARFRRPVPAEPTEYRSTWEHVAFYLFTIVPFLALAGGIALAATWHSITLLDAGLAVVMYVITGLGVTVGYHRHFTHGSFKAKRPLRIALAIAGSLAIEGGILRWVADHRKHHRYSDGAGDPHSPWRFGTSPMAVLRGFWWAHTGWLFDRNQVVKEKYAPDLAADPAMVRIHRLFPMWVAISLLLPPAVAYAVTGGSWRAAATEFLWASLVRVFLLHHVTYSINSVCHMMGRRPFRTRDRSTNVWPLAVLSFGESWHNLHHADPTCARHGALPRQVDSSARLIKWFERVGWVWDVRWPDEERLAARRAD
jgi:stearoyl-CoA desaturase (delta-9 desaturase)